MKNGRGDGNTLVADPGGTLAAGAALIIGDIVGIIFDDGVDTVPATFAREGEFEYKTATTVAVGDTVIFDGVDEFTDVTPVAGHGVCTKKISAALGWIKLTPAAGTA